MANKSKANNQNVQRKRAQNNSGSNRKRRSQRKGTSGSNDGLYQAMRLVADPCQGSVDGATFRGEIGAYKVRAKSDGGASLFHSLTSVSTFSGYVAWFPGYHCGPYTGAVERGLSSFTFWTANDSSPTNSVSSACYGGTAASTTKGLADPAFNFLSGGTCAQARTVAACLSMRYVGTMTSLAGEYCVLSDVSPSTLVTDLASVDELFALAGNPRRLSLDPVDLRYRPADHDCVYRTEGAQTNSPGGDKPIQSGSATPAASSTLGPNLSDQRAIVIAFRGVQQPASDIQDVLKFSYTKVIEWVPQANSGLPVPVSSGSGAATPGDVSALLTARDPLWASRPHQSSDVMKVSGAALAGVPAPRRPGRMRTLGGISITPGGIGVSW
jgi:hypothetical protein